MKTALTAVFGLFALVVAAHPAAAAKPPDLIAAEAKYLPDHCQMVGIVRVKQILESPAYKQLRKESPMVRNQEKALADNMPLPLEQIEQIVFGGAVTGDEEGLFVVRTRKKIDAADVVWSKNRVDPPIKQLVHKSMMYRRRSESYCLVAEDLLLFGRASAIEAVLERAAPTDFSAALDKALTAADLTATVVFALDVPAIHKKRVGGPVPFIPGLNMKLAEALTEGLALTAKFGEMIEVSATAHAMINLPAKFLTVEGAATYLGAEADRFAKFHRTALKDERNASEDVLGMFNFNIAADGKRATASTRFAAPAFAQLLKLLVSDK